LEESNEEKTICGLAYSAEKRQLYWLNTKKLSVQFWDFRTRRLESIDILKSSLNGLAGLTNPRLTSLAVHGEKLYISSGGALYHANNEPDTTIELVKLFLFSFCYVCKLIIV
jgi:hypothetical protein